MRAMPRTWPSIRLKRLAQDALMSPRMHAIYPHRVSDSTPEERRMARASAPPTHLGSSSGGSGLPDTAPDNALTHDHCHHAGDARTPPTPPPAPDGTIYTCPMHLQIRQVGPGVCPICGMALEPDVASVEAAPNAELADMTRRFWIALVLTLPVLALEMGGHLTNLHMLLDQTWSNWLQFVLATPVVLWGGAPFFVRGWQSLVTRNLNMFTLIVMGIGVAWLYGAVAVYFEAAAVITVLVLLGQVLELRAREQTSGAIRALLDLAPKTARRL